MLTTNPFDDDKLREECGIFGAANAETASALVALGLHALQHRGQEAAGITSWDGHDFHSSRAQGHVAGNFDNDEAIRGLPGDTACGNVRYSTTGETSLRNVQPLYAELSSGGFAIAHNGNISNAMKLRRELIRRGSIFQSTSDTEVIIHLVATSTYRTLLDRFVDALRQVEGAYSLICMTPEGMIACRDPLGIRPLVMGMLAAGGPIFASLGALALLLVAGEGLPLASVPLSHYQITVNPSLPALPLFTLAGIVVARTGAAKRLGDLLRAVFGAGPRAVALAAALMCSAFTALTGGSGVTILALGGLLFPLLTEAGYPERRAIGLLTGASALGVLIAPSVPLVIYAVIARVPIQDMFVAGLLPAVIMIACLLEIGRAHV